MDGTTTYSHRMYIVNVSFLAPMEGSVNIPAKDAEDAKRIVTEQFKEREKFAIIDVTCVDDIQPPKMHDDGSAAPPSKIILN